MNRTEAKKFILSLSPGETLDALVATLVMKKKVYPLIYWDSCLGAGKFYPFVTSRFRLMVHMGPEKEEMTMDNTMPVYVYEYSTSLDAADEVMHKLGISLVPSKDKYKWVAKVDKYKVLSSRAAVAVCQAALFKVLKL